jgi:YedE family putative selenium metabolism protein
MLLMFLLFVTGVGGLFLTSAEGSGAMKAPWYIAIAAGLAVGALAQRSRLCMAGGNRDAVMFRDFSLISGFVAVIVTVLAGNLLLGQFTGFSFADQPVAHADSLWNFLGMALVGWAPFFWAAVPCDSSFSREREIPIPRSLFWACLPERRSVTISSSRPLRTDPPETAKSP